MTLLWFPAFIEFVGLVTADIQLLRVVPAHPATYYLDGRRLLEIEKIFAALP